MITESNFQPAEYLSNPHIQTLFPTLFRRFKNVSFQQEELALPDGDFVDLVWNSKPLRTCHKPIVVVFHGLEGSVASPYASGIMQRLNADNWHAVVMHFRGCSGRGNRLARTYHSGETEDAKYLLQWLQTQYPHAPLAAIGFSLGGNMLLKLLGEMGTATHLRAAISVCAPLRLDLCANQLQIGFSRIYQYHFMRSLKRKVLNKYDQHDYRQLIGLDPQAVTKLNNFWQFDDAFTAPIHNFLNVQDYYTKASARQYLNAIEIPTLVIQSLDDPFMPPAVIPDETELATNVQLEISEKGGHLGFIAGSIWQPKFWLEQRLPQFLRQQLID